MHLNRKPQRKKNYDYSQPGYYAVTLCTLNRLCQFGDIKEGENMLAKAIDEFREDAIKEGIEKKAWEDAKKLKNAGVSIEIIANCTGLSRKDVEKI